MRDRWRRKITRPCASASGRNNVTMYARYMPGARGIMRFVVRVLRARRRTYGFLLFLPFSRVRSTRPFPSPTGPAVTDRINRTPVHADVVSFRFSYCPFFARRDRVYRCVVGIAFVVSK